MTWIGELLGDLLSERSLIGALGAIVGGLITGYFNLWNTRRKNSYELLEATTKQSDQVHAYAVIYKFLASTPGIELIPVKQIQETDKLEESLVVIFMTYQYIAHAAKIKLLDRDAVLIDSYAAMSLMRKRFRLFIEHYRSALGRPKLWSEFVSFVDDKKNESRHAKLNR